MSQAWSSIMRLGWRIGPLAARVAFAAAAMALAGCAATPPPNDPDAVAEFQQNDDPLEPMNRAIFGFNRAVDQVAIKPAAEGYRSLVPRFGRDRVSDFLDNLRSPWVLANDLLQGHPRNAGTTLGRFALNTTFGVLGLYDVATPIGLVGHEADLGQTLGLWGMAPGPYLVLPIVGSYDVRDALGDGIEAGLDPATLYLQRRHLQWVTWTRFGVTLVSEREAYLDQLDDIERSSLDYYAALRSFYLQRRAALVEAAHHDGAPSSVNQ